MRKLLAALLLLPALACAQILSGTSTSTGFGATPGISGQTTQPSFAAALTTTIVPSIALGSPTATFTRATTATVTDQDSIVRPVLSGEVRFQGARRVRNWLLGTEALTGGTWGTVPGGTGSAAVTTAGLVAPDATTTAFRVQLDRGTGTTGADISNFIQGTSIPTGVGVTQVASIWLKSNTVQSQKLRLRSNINAVDVIVTTSWQRFAVIRPNETANTLELLTRGDLTTDRVIDVLVWHPQLEDATGQSNTNPSEYVSVGVLSAPFQGANVDGVQYFGGLNRNVIQQNLFSHSGDLASPWTNGGGIVTIAGGQTDPDGGSTALLLTSTDNVGSRSLANPNFYSVSGQYVTVRFWTKGFVSTTTAAYGIHNGSSFVTQSSRVVSGPGVVAPQTGIQNISGLSTSQWSQIEVTGLTSTTFTAFFFYPGTAGASQGMANYFWHPQANAGTAGGTYLPTTTAAIAANGIVDDTGYSQPIASATLLGYLAEGARTNIALQSEDFATTWAVIDTTITTNQIAAPDGNLTADLATEGSAGTAIVAQAGLTIVAGNTVTASIYLKRNNHDWVAVIVGDNGAATGFRAWFNLNTGVAGTAGAVGTGTIAGSTINALPNGWYRVTLTGTVDPATTTLARMFITSAAADNNPARAANSAHYLWGAQFERAPFSSTYIPTTTVSGLRNSDVLSYPSSGNVSTTVGTSYAEVSLNGMNGVIQIFLGGPNSGAAPLYLYNNGAGFGNIQNFDGTTTVAKTITSMATVQKVIGSWGPTGKSITGAGAASPGTGAFDGDMNSGAAIEVGSCGGNFQAFGTVRNVVIFPAQFTDAQLQGKTGP